MKGLKKTKKIAAVITLMALAVSLFAIPGFAQSADEAGASTNLFERIYSAISANLSDILCALTLVGSIILAIAYKKGLMPILTGAVSAIGKGVGRLQGEAEKFNKESAEQISGIAEKVASVAEIIESFSERLSALEREIERANEGGERFDVILKAVSAEAELLYDIFMSSALPQYQKDAVSKRINEINSTLSEA